ncbi:nucleotidyl transferase AbiEii/AbiGii toxin family protein [Pectinatus brassicae]|uniref:Putative nucleotidyltransferase component of viral defense system n=1 Tax=Pectinatus brassicae TaxID=862415 RepID=A0A840UM43_9FIRM|nr:nucleotidyl transferase AbiEii/AbiGii toxin family protein [Pectinatus brassicae]MBB5336867.1 putative nucleotidyltransferase component of viral defense system [Pectinatus brassicae]
MELDKQKNFKDLVQMTSIYKGIPEMAIQKDYLICKILGNLAETEYVQNCVFKGGTSLSKCYPGSIERFSEDIDLTYLPKGNIKKKALSRELKIVEKILIGECFFEPINAERNDRNKSSQVWLNNMLKDTGIKLEIGAVVRPEPFEMRPIKSYLQEFLEAREEQRLLKEYGWHEIFVNVLDIRRTFIDKLLAVKRHALCGTLKNKVRHIYDIKKLMDRLDIQEFLKNTDELRRILRLTKETDIEYIKKRATARDYDPVGKFAYGSWQNIISAAEIKKRYESLHVDLLYTSIKQDFSEALAVFAQIDKILSDIGE